MTKTSQAISKNKNTETISVIAKSWADVMAHNAKSHPERLPPNAPRFTDYAWRNFNAKTVMEILVADTPTYRALKPILFSGLCTWVVCPNRNSLRQNGMLLVGIEHLRAAEAIGRAAFSGHDIRDHDMLGDMFGRMFSLGADFYSDFYFPIGGLAQVLRSTTPKNFSSNLHRYSGGSNIIAATMEIYDFHARHLSDKRKYYIASESKGYELYREISLARKLERQIGSDYFKSAWEESGKTAAMIYAASTINLEDGATLLDAIRAGKASFEEHGVFLQQWIGRARYSAEAVLGATTKPELGSINTLHLSNIDSEIPPPPKFNLEEEANIAAEFDQPALLGARQKGVKRERKSRR